jgi:hypothetical protein
LKGDENVTVGVPVTHHSILAKILTSDVLETYTSSVIVNTPAAVGPLAVYVDPPISNLSWLMIPLALADQVIVNPSNLIGSETVNVPLAISTSVDDAAASTESGKLESQANVSFPPLNL